MKTHTLEPGRPASVASLPFVLRLFSVAIKMPEARSCIKLRGLFSVDGKSKIREAIFLASNEGTHCRWHRSRVHV